MEGCTIAKDRGRSTRKTIGENIKKDLDANNLTIDMVYDKILWHRLLHIVDST